MNIIEKTHGSRTVRCALVANEQLPSIVSYIHISPSRRVLDLHLVDDLVRPLRVEGELVLVRLDEKVRDARFTSQGDTCQSSMYRTSG